MIGIGVKATDYLRFQSQGFEKIAWNQTFSPGLQTPATGRGSSFNRPLEGQD
jgi:hypothetical protein